LRRMASRPDHGSLRGRHVPPHDGVGSIGLVMSAARSPNPWIRAATEPARWPTPRSDMGPRSAARRICCCATARSCRLRLPCRPAELRAVAQHAMQDDGELARNGDGGLLGADLLGQPRALGLAGPTTSTRGGGSPRQPRTSSSGAGGRRNARCGQCSPPRLTGSAVASGRDRRPRWRIAGSVRDRR
jgi:hypothetical protein